MTEKTMRILVTGSRKWADEDSLRHALDCVAEQAFAAGCAEVVVVHGGAAGADNLADRWARQRGMFLPIRAERHPADWKTHKRRAGILRNRDMVKLGADVCLAFVLDESPGATHCGALAERHDIPTRWFRQYTNPPGETNG